MLSRKQDSFSTFSPSLPNFSSTLIAQQRLRSTSTKLRNETIKKEGTLRRRCRHRPVQYLNNIIEQDHRAIKCRVNGKQGFREFHAARRTIQGYEAINMIRKGQVQWVRGSDVRCQIRFIGKLFGLTA
jgi:transposase-like protein